MLPVTTQRHSSKGDECHDGQGDPNGARQLGQETMKLAVHGDSLASDGASISAVD
jgi:hypothetical protein